MSQSFQSKASSVSSGPSLPSALLPSESDTPMLKQYKAIKSEYQDTILFFRLGDFYEMFLDDAIQASKELELTLTGRGKDDARIPMCGIPYHAADNYIARLVGRGYKVAICEQVEDPTVSKGITKREVVKVITPGTVLEEGYIEDQDNTYLAAVCPIASQRFAVSYADVSTGEFKILISESVTDLGHLLHRLAVKELIVPPDTDLPIPDTCLKNTQVFLDANRAEDELIRFFKLHSLDSFGIRPLKEAFGAAWAIIQYLKQTQRNQLPQLTRLLATDEQERLSMDAVTIQNLELTQTIHRHDSKSKSEGTLFWVLNYTQSAMGARLLKSLLKSPYRDAALIRKRLDAVGVLVGDLLSREEIRDMLSQVYDLERLTARIGSDIHNPRDVLALKQSIVVLGDMAGILSHLSGDLFAAHLSFFQQLSEPESPFCNICDLIDRALMEDAPPIIRDGHVIKDGYSSELDELKSSFKTIKTWIGTLEAREREATGIKSLKVGFNKVFGYYIELTNAYRDKAPEHYIRKQTLANAERYITPELKEKETILLNGEEKQKALEIQLYQEFINQLKPHISALQTLAQHVADLDVLQSLATASQKNNYVKPVISDAPQTLRLIGSRHPVLEKSPAPFTPNTVEMSATSNRFILITGPNMAGKSTLMRQVALIIVMAQIGCFVPAKEASLSITDKLFTRIGSLDNLYAGQSTFMVEMLETATILNNATANSMIILDEVGRGTSTYDGMSIAWAVSEYIHNQIGARTLFATHYHELNALATTQQHLSIYNMKITEVDGKIVFNYLFEKGPANKSYGVHVAEMAGLPASLIKRANALMQDFEAQSAAGMQKPVNQLSLF